MTEALTPAYLVHVLPGRIRLRIPEKRGDAAYFAALLGSLSQLQIGQVSVNPGTGSVLLRAQRVVRPGELATSARRLALFDLRNGQPTPVGNSPLVTASAGLQGLNGLVQRASGGHLDLKSGLFVLLLVLAARQSYRGQFMVPGMSLLWYAFSLVSE